MRWIAVVIVGLLSPAGVAAQGNAEAIGRALVPLLGDLRRVVVVEQGSLPPSPFTGRNSTLVAVRIGVRSADVPREVLDVLDRLAAWKPDRPLDPKDRTLLDTYVERLRRKVVSRLAAAGKPVTCDDSCVIDHLTKPGPLFGSSAREQREARDELMLNTLTEVVEEESS